MADHAKLLTNGVILSLIYGVCMSYASNERHLSYVEAFLKEAPQGGFPVPDDYPPSQLTQRAKLSKRNRNHEHLPPFLPYWGHWPRSAISSLDLIAAQAAGAGATSGNATVLPPIKLRGYGTLFARFRSLQAGQSSLTHITCESASKAHLVAEGS